jgi:hypothetical protein
MTLSMTEHQSIRTPTIHIESGEAGQELDEEKVDFVENFAKKNGSKLWGISGAKKGPHDVNLHFFLGGGLGVSGRMSLNVLPVPPWAGSGGMGGASTSTCTPCANGIASSGRLTTD